LTDKPGTVEGGGKNEAVKEPKQKNSRNQPGKRNEKRKSKTLHKFEGLINGRINTSQEGKIKRGESCVRRHRWQMGALQKKKTSDKKRTSKEKRYYLE